MSLKNLSRAFAVLGAISLAPFGRATPFSFTKIADTTDGYSNFSLPAINQNGEIAFNATLGGATQIFTSTGGTPTSVYSPSSDGSRQLEGDPVINSAGHIAFIARNPNLAVSVQNIYLWTGGTHANLVYNAEANILLVHGASVAMTPNSDAVTYAYMIDSEHPFIATDSVQKNALGFGLFHLGRMSESTNGTAILTTAGHNNSPLTVLYSTAPTAFDFSNPSPIYNDPNVLFSATTEHGYIIESFQPNVAVNARGTVVLSAMIAGGNSAGETSAIAYYSDGHARYIAGGAGLPVAVNDSDVVLAGSNVFDGSSLTAFLSVGDPFMGSTVSSINYMPAGFNNANQLAFEATLADGRQGIYTVSVPEPTAMACLGIAGLSAFVRRRRK